MKQSLRIHKPENPLPVVFDSPHSGQLYPDDFNYACDFYALQFTEDKYINDLFAGAPDFDAPLLEALFPRSYIDANRRIDDIDPALLSAPWPDDESIPGITPGARSDAGIGLIRRLIRPGMPVYDRALTPQEVIHRIDHYYRPYHDALENLIEDAHYNYGQVFHINCHSMPNASAKPKKPHKLQGSAVRHSDFVLGNRDGTTCSIWFTRALKGFLTDLGYIVTINDPFKGVELIRRYSNPARGRHSIQIEINKALYMDETTYEKNANYSALKNDIEKLIKFCISCAQDSAQNIAAD